MAAENTPGTQNFGLASKRQPIHGYQDKKLAPEANAGKPHCPCDVTRPPTLPQPRPGRPRHRSPATSTRRTAQHPVRPARDVAPRKGSQPTGRPSNAAVAPSSPSPRELPPVPPSPVDESVASSSHRARQTQSTKKTSRASARRHLPERSYGCFPWSRPLSLRAKPSLPLVNALPRGPHRAKAGFTGAAA